MNVYRIILLYILVAFASHPGANAQTGGMDVKKGLIAHWSFDGHTSDSTKYANSMSNKGATPQGAVDRCGNEGRCYYFDGDQAYMEAANSESFTGNFYGITMAAWIYPKKSNSDDLSFIVGKWAFDQKKDQFALFLNHNNIPTVAIGDPKKPDEGVYAKTKLVPDRWYHVVATWQRDGGVKIFVNGKLDTKTKDPVGKIMNNTSDVSIKIGRQVAGRSRPFKGYLDEVRVYRRALSEEEITLAYDLDMKPCGPGRPSSTDVTSSTFLLKGKLLDEATGRPVEGTISFSNEVNRKSYGYVDTDAVAGKYEIKVPKDGMLMASISAPGYLSKKEAVPAALFADKTKEIVEYNFKTQPIVLDNSEGEDSGNKSDSWVTLKGFVMEKSGKTLSMKYKIIQQADGEMYTEEPNDPKTGKFQIDLPAGKKYTIIGQVEGFGEVKAEVDFSNQFFGSMEKNFILEASNTLVFIGKIMDSTTKTAIPGADATIKDKATGTVFKKLKAGADGDIKLDFKRGGSYTISIIAPSYKEINAEINTDKYPLASEIKQEYFLASSAGGDKAEPKGETVWISGKTFNADNQQGMSAKVIFKDKESGNVSEIVSAEDGTYKIQLPVGRKYAAIAKLDGFKSELKNVSLIKPGYDDLNVNIGLKEEIKAAAVCVITGKTSDHSTGKPLASTVYFEDLETGKEVAEVKTDAMGKYQVSVPKGKEYGVYAKADNYFSEDHTISKEETANDKFQRDIFLHPLKVGEKIRLNNVFFDTGKSSLRPESESELKRLIAIFEKYPNLEIELSGHTDDQGSDVSNLALSKNRAKAVKDYLIEKGIDAKKLTSEGYGETKPETSNDTPEGRQINRRVEFKILKI